MSSKLLSDVGEALYGPRWQTDLSRSLGVSDRTVRRWAAGTIDIPAGIYPELRDMLDTKATEIKAMSHRIASKCG